MGSVSQAYFEYDKIGSLYRLKCGDTVLAEMDRVAIVFALSENGSTVLHKHGLPEDAIQWFRWAKARYTQCNLQWIADELRILISDSIDVADLNKVLTDGGYIATLLIQQTGNCSTDADVL